MSRFEMKKRRVLFVEDDQVDQLAIRRIVRDKNLPYDFRIVESVSQAQALLKAEKFDIVITDFMLKDGTGFDIFNSVGEAPFVVMTGAGNEEIAVEAIKSGASDYLVKESDSRHLSLLPTVIEAAIDKFQMERELDMLQQAMRDISDCVYITDLDARVIYVNDAFEKTYGYTREEMQGQTSQILWESEKIRDVGQDEDLAHKRKDGSTFPVLLSRSAIKDREGKEVNIITVVHDITERKKMENALRDAIDKYGLLLERLETEKKKT